MVFKKIRLSLTLVTFAAWLPGLGQTVYRHTVLLATRPRVITGDPQIKASTDTICCTLSELGPNSGAGVLLSFNRGALPAGAVIDSACLQVFKIKTPDAPGARPENVQVTLNAVKDGISDTDLIKSTAVQDETTYINVVRFSRSTNDRNYLFQFDRAQARSLFSTDKKIELLLFSKNKSTSFYYNDPALWGPGYTPRVEIIYHLPSDMNVTDNGVQINFNPQNNRQSPWRTDNNVTLFTATKIFIGGADFKPKGKPVLFDDQLIMPVQHTSAGNGQAGVYLEVFNLDNPLQKVSSTGPLPGDGLSFPPLTDCYRRIFTITNNQNIYIDNLSAIFKQKQQININYNGKTGNLITANLLIGTDASFYVPTRHGLLAFTANGDLKWQLSTTGDNNEFSTPSLSNDETKLYVYDQQKGKLLTINNLNGTEINRYPKNDDMRLLTPVNPNWNVLPIPVANTGKNMVVISAAIAKTSDQSRPVNSLIFFDADGALLQTFGAPGDEIFSQAVITQYGAYALKGYRLMHYNLLADADKSKVMVVDSSLMVHRTANAMVTNLVANNNGFIYALNASDKVLDIFRSNCEQVGHDNIDATLFSRNENLVFNRLAMAPDGSLFTSNENNVFWLAPKDIDINPSQRSPLSGSLRNNYIYQGGNQVITVSDGARVKKDSVVTLSSSGSIQFNGDFIIEKGAELKVLNGAHSALSIDSAGNIGFGRAKPKAAIDMSNLSNGFVLPNVSVYDIPKDQPVAEGTIVYDPDLKVLAFFNGTRWLKYNGRPCYYEPGEVIDGKLVMVHHRGAADPALINYDWYSRDRGTFARRPAHIIAKPTSNNGKQPVLAVWKDGRIGIGNQQPMANLDMSNNKTGVLLPFLTSNQSDILRSANKVKPVPGRLIFDSKNRTLAYFSPHEMLYCNYFTIEKGF